MLEIETVGIETAEIDEQRLIIACMEALNVAGVEDGHLCVSFVEEAKIRDLNQSYRGKDVATDVLSFPVDGTDQVAGPRELGDIIICPGLTEDPIEAVVHGALHLAGFDHEADEGQMLELQRQILTSFDKNII